ncbi:Ig-like domain-containing protein [Brucella tritici]|uniref:Ig-like domain-containing protein n=1 Tax=Brucella tritici TaxID=94626 RepID=UPI003D6CBCB8
MRKVILTQQDNILFYAPTCQADGFVLAPNDYVELPVSYKDKFNQPIAKRRLMWRLVEGEAILRQPTTLTNGKGQGVNYIKVQLDDPDTQITVRLAVWPQDEPDAELEFECVFGTPAAAPPVTSGNVLQTVFPRNDSSGKTVISTQSSYAFNGTLFYFLNTDQYGNMRLNSSGVSYKIQDSSNNISDATNKYNNFLYVSEPRIYFPANPSTLSISFGNSTASSNLVITSTDTPTMQVNNFWPPNGSVLQPGSVYPLRALYCGGNGSPFSNADILWSLADTDSNSSLVSISPSLSATNSDGVAVSTIMVDYVPYRMSDKIDLNVSLYGGPKDHPNLAYDKPTFKIGGERFVGIFPDASIPDVLSSASEPVFSVILQNENGSPVAGARILWTASHHSFEPSLSQTDANGNATSNLIAAKIPQGTVETVSVTITPPKGAPYTGSYKVGASTIKQLAPANPGPFKVGNVVTVQVQVKTPDGRPVDYLPLTVSPGSDLLTINNSKPKTSSLGIATFEVTAKAPVNSNVLVFENPSVTVPTAIPLNFTQSAAITITPPASGDMRYDTWLPVKATLTNGSGQLVTGATLTWSCTNGVQLENASTKTDSYGVSNNRILYETLSGYPDTAITTQLTVTADDGASTTQSLTFTKSGLLNKLTLVGPKDGTQLPVDQETIVTLQLTNQFGHSLANYPITWEEPSDKAVVLDFDPKTDAQGKATATVKGTVAGLAQFDANAQLALAHCEFRYDFIGVALPDYSVLIGRNYAHNPPKGSDVAPSDDSQTVMFTFRYLSGNIPQPGKDVLWYFNPRTPDLRFFDAQNKAVQVDPSGTITIKTDDSGLAVLKIGSLTRFSGTISIAPKDALTTPAFEYTFVIATFNSGDIDQSLMPVLYNPNPIAIPDRPTASNPGFTLKVQKPQNYVQGKNVVFWISTNPPGKPAQENVQVITLEEAIFDGVQVPYTHVYPDPNQTGNNFFSYMIVEPATSNSILSRIVVPVVTGNATSNHPDYNNTNRTLPAPHLNNYANVINGDSITNGLDIYIPYSSTWVANNVINLMIYLNGEDGSGNVIGNTVPYTYYILPSDISGKKDIVIHIPQEQLSGYKDGTFESDYYTGGNWSLILENVTLDTADWH